MAWRVSSTLSAGYMSWRVTRLYALAGHQSSYGDESKAHDLAGSLDYMAWRVMRVYALAGQFYPHDDVCLVRFGCRSFGASKNY